MPKNCIDCDAVSMCRNLCPIATKTINNEEYMHCNYLRKIYNSIKNNRERLINIPPSIKKFNFYEVP